MRDEAIVSELVALAEPDRGSQLRSFVSAGQYRPLYRLVRRYLPRGGEVLDWGVGNGHFSYFLCRAGYRASGYSFEEFAFKEWLPDPSAYRFARGGPVDPVTIPYPAEAFDGVCSVGVLEHVRETGGDELASLREIRRVLKPGGVFICYHFPNRASLVESLARWVPGKHVHPYKYTRRAIDDLAQAAGLELVRAGRYGLLPRNVFGRLPRGLRRSGTLAMFWDGLDAMLAGALSGYCQNHLFVARKPRQNRA
ncbi:MAG: class I SAM-dependent methyltransferase [Planctomycetes bacterium]|nr:class I SAM-dependent methyltransferase [Planctomycetota bacterium]